MHLYDHYITIFGDPMKSKLAAVAVTIVLTLVIYNLFVRPFLVNMIDTLS